MPHTVRSFDEELNSLLAATARLGDAVVAQIDAALLALSPDAVIKVAADRIATTQLHLQVESQVLRILALRSPMAEDLRFVVATLKVAESLKQTADHAASIAERAVCIETNYTVQSLGGIRRLCEDVRDMQKTVMEAFTERDADKAMAVWHHDRVVDEQHSGLFRELLTYMMEDSRNISVCSEFVFIAKDIERIGDQATNIAEMVYFLVKGAPVNEARRKGDIAASIAG